MIIYTIPVLASSIMFVYKILKFSKQDVNVVRQLLHKNNSSLLIGHRGGEFEGPENTLALIENAAKNGATGVEIDLDFTKDCVPIIFHDDRVDRTTDGQGRVKDYLYKDIIKLNAAAKNNRLISRDGITKLEFQKIPTLTEMVTLCLKHDLTIILDVKGSASLTVNALHDLESKFANLSNNMLVTSFNPSVVYQVRKKCPNFIVGLIWRYRFLSHSRDGTPYYPWYSQPLFVAFDHLYCFLLNSIIEFLGLSLLSMHKDHLSKRYVEQNRKSEVEIIAWTVNSPIEKDFLMKNLKIPIMTDSILNIEHCPE